MSETKPEETISEAPADKPKAKLHTIMEAASALTSLGDEESENETSPASASKDAAAAEEAEDAASDDSKPQKRYLPDYKKPDAAPTFPEKLMSMMRFADQQGEGFCVKWLEDGKSFIIRQPEDFTRNVIPKYFKATKFSSFTRKLYRWGFRQVNRGIGPEDPIIFGNEHFQRDQPELIKHMRSITAAGTRKQEQARMAEVYQLKRTMPMDDHFHESNKRMLLDSYLHQQSRQQLPQFGGANFRPYDSLSLNNALQQPQLAMGGYDMMQSAQPSFSSFHPQNYPNQASTAEIVNAAINALRYAS